MYRNLSEFIARLEREGELQRVSVPVDPVYEIAEITDRMSKQPDGGKALLFEQTGTPFPVLTNMMGSDRRMAMALGVESLDELTRRLDDLLQQAVTPKNSLLDKLRMLPLLAEMSRWLPRTSSSRGECQQVVLQGEEASLGALPVQNFAWSATGDEPSRLLLPWPARPAASERLQLTHEGRGQPWVSLQVLAAVPTAGLDAEHHAIERAEPQALVADHHVEVAAGLVVLLDGARRRRDLEVIDGGGGRELRTAEGFDEITPLAAAGLLERGIKARYSSLDRHHHVRDAEHRVREDDCANALLHASEQELRCKARAKNNLRGCHWGEEQEANC